MQKQLLIELYDIDTEKFVDEIDISKYSLKKINKIIPPEDQFDYEYCNGYEIEKNDYDNLKNYIVELNDINFKKYSISIIMRRI